MGEVGGSRHYIGAGIGPSQAAWTCPACGEFNVGQLEQGCSVCGAGKPGHRVGAAPPPPPFIKGTPSTQREVDPVRQAGVQWWELHPQGTVVDAFVAGYQLALAQVHGGIVRRAPPVAADIKALAPETREQRTIVTALKLFRDQVLPLAEEEIESGEFCSRQELDALIARIEETL